LRMPTTDEQLAINTNAHLTESQNRVGQFHRSAAQMSRGSEGILRVSEALIAWKPR
jgi:hypothetical protein